MTGKQTGLGDGCWVNGSDVSGDTIALGRIGGGPATLECTGIDKLAFERLGGKLDGEISLTSWFSPTINHPVLAALPRADVIVSYLHTTLVGGVMASMVAKQANYDGNRAEDGRYTFDVQALANGYGLEWGLQHTGKVTHTTGTTIAGIDGGVSAETAFGCAAFLHVFALTGTNVIVTLEHSSDDGGVDPYTTLLTFTSATAGLTAERKAVAAGASSIKRYVRAKSSGTFTSATFGVQLSRYESARAL